MACIFFEGMPGSGKSTSADALASYLVSRGRTGAAYQETTPDHPLRIGDLDAMGAAMADIHLKFTPEQFAARAMDRYLGFATDAKRPPIVIFESFPIQSHMRVLMQMNAPAELIWSFWTDIQAAVKPADPCLIFFEEIESGRTIREAVTKRGDEWAQYVVNAFEQTPYATSRGLRGLDEITSMFKEYGDLANEAVRRWQYPKLFVEASPASFKERDATIANWVEQRLP